jgi:alcohol dehydrogenase class IV
MQRLRKFVAPELIFGQDAISMLGRYCRDFGAQKVLLVTDPGVIATGVVARVVEVLKKAGIEAEVFSGVSPNPRATEVMSGVEVYSRQGCDVIVAVGGGSSIDCAKGIGIVSTNRRHILEFVGVDNVAVPGPPLICIPTTAGSSADVSQFAIITDEQERVKLAIISKVVVPDVSLIDPSTTITMDHYLTVCTAIDALVHAIEAFVSSAHSPIMDLHALEAIRLIRANLLPVLKQPGNLELRDQMMLGSLEAGLAFSNASLGAVHAMAHSLGGYLDLPHGECNAILLEHVMTYNYAVSPERYDRIGEALGLDLRGMTPSRKQRALVDFIRQMKQSAGLMKTLGEQGVKATDIPILARKAMADPCLITNPRRPTQRDLEVIYEEAL